MPLDIYDPCPCGSGKKLKFCCHPIADEMDRAIRLMEGNQPRVALQQLEALARKHPQNTWIGTTRGLILLETGEASAARDVLRSLLEHQPDHEFAIVLFAAAMFQADGMETAKKAIHRAFQRSAKKFPSMVSGLAATMASILGQDQKLMAAREHLALALRLSPEKQRQELFVKLLEFDGDEEIPYPLRGSHVLPPIEGSEDQQKEIKKAQKYAAVGCWNTAADLFLALTKSLSESAVVWHSVGLCRAWDGDELKAVEALHRAAELYRDHDFPVAVECEAIAQLLDRMNTTDVVEICTYEAQVESVGRLLTMLDEHPRFQRLPTPKAAENGQVRPVAGYQILDRPKWSGDSVSLTLDALPKLQGHISIYDAMPESGVPALSYLTGDRGAGLDDIRSLFESTAQGLIKWSTDEPQPEITGSIPRELQPIRWLWSFPQGLSRQVERELSQQGWAQLINDAWPAGPLKCLGGQSPNDAASDPNKRLPLTAAVYLLDAHCQQHGREFDLSGMLSRFHLDPLPELEIENSTPVTTQSLMQMHRLPVERLTDEQLVSVVNRAMLTQHRRFLYRALKVALERPDCQGEIDMKRIYRTIVEICMQNGRRDEALHWIQVARSQSPRDESQFEYIWQWDITELISRLEVPSDPALQPLLDRFVHYYGRKVPQMRGFVEQILASFGVPSPWESASAIVSGGMTGVSSGSIWSPGAPAETTTAPSKLWLPGQ